METYKTMMENKINKQRLKIINGKASKEHKQQLLYLLKQVEQEILNHE